VEFVDDNGTTQAITVPVTWSVVEVVNPSAPWWLRSPGAKNGLTWGNLADGTSSWSADVVVGTASTTDTVQLTDVVGSRTVTLEASVTIGGVSYTGQETVSFGDGPLSVFTKAPESGKKWAVRAGTQWTAASYNGDFTADDNSFPAAAYCDGTVNNMSSNNGVGVTQTGGSPPYAATFDTSNGWRVGDFWSSEYYSTTSKLPTIGQLVAVSKYNASYDPTIYRKGAAFAANWPDDSYGSGYYEYWTGQVGFYGAYGGFYADGVNLANGGDYWDNVVSNDAPVSVCVP
jgi:hypothetical protein